MADDGGWGHGEATAEWRSVLENDTMYILVLNNDQWEFQDPIHWRYRSHIFLAYFLGLFFREYPSKIWPEIWYSTSILGSWRSPIEMRMI